MCAQQHRGVLASSEDHAQQRLATKQIMFITPLKASCEGRKSLRESSLDTSVTDRALPIQLNQYALDNAACAHVAEAVASLKALDFMLQRPGCSSTVWHSAASCIDKDLSNYGAPNHHPSALKHSWHCSALATPVASVCTHCTDVAKTPHVAETPRKKLTSPAHLCSLRSKALKSYVMK